MTRQWAETYILRVEKIGAYLARLRNSRSGWRSTGRRHNVVKWCPFASTNRPHSSGPRLTCNLVNWHAENFSTAVQRPRVYAILFLVHVHAAVLRCSYVYKYVPGNMHRYCRIYTAISAQNVSGYSCTSRSRGTQVPTPNTSTSRGTIPGTSLDIKVPLKVDVLKEERHRDILRVCQTSTHVCDRRIITLCVVILSI